MIRYEKKDEGSIFEIRAHDNIRGIVGILIAGQYGQLTTIEKISVQLKRHGIGTHFIQELEVWAAQNNSKFIASPLPICEADGPEDIRGAREFFQRMGYQTPLGIFLSKKIR